MCARKGNPISVAAIRLPHVATQHMVDTLIILNPHAGSRRARTVWEDLQPAVEATFGEVMLAVTQQPADVFPVLQQAQDAGIRRVIAVGGDGTNNSIVNAIMRLCKEQPAAPPFIFGCIPVGTGRDWARSIGAPLDLNAVVGWLGAQHPRPVDAVQMTLDGDEHRYYLNIASTGLGGEVDRRVNALETRRPWSFVWAVVQSIVHYQPQPVTVHADGDLWYDGGAYLVVVANGTTFGSGMHIAPRARVDDGLLDVVLVRDVPRHRLLWALRRVYSGTHLTHPAVMYRRAEQVTVTYPAGAAPLDIDGEYASGARLHFQVQPGCLSALG